MARLYHRLQVVAHLVKKHADSELLAAAGVTTAQAAVLAVLGDGESTQGAVARELRLSEPAVTAMAERLAAAGLVDRYRSDADARVRLLRLTPAGREALTAAERAFAAINAVLRETVGDARLEQLESTLEEIGVAVSRRMA